MTNNKSDGEIRNEAVAEIFLRNLPLDVLRKLYLKVKLDADDLALMSWYNQVEDLLDKTTGVAKLREDFREVFETVCRERLAPKN